VAAVRTHRHFVGFDIDEAYVRAAKERVAAEVTRRGEPTDDRPWRVVAPPAAAEGTDPGFQARASREGPMAKTMADELLVTAGFEIVGRKHKVAGTEITFVARDQTGTTWHVDVSGAFTKGNDRAGLRRTDTLWKALGKASVLHEVSRGQTPAPPFLLLTTDLPAKGSAGAKALKAVRGPGRPVFDAVEMLSEDGQLRLRRYAEQGPGIDP
jgi:hypothetical protein